ncbi:MAG TPA: DUF4258 domain-containing protein [Methylomirabilota bacterium]|jgi:hypothetical protein|nr:DUF4258 domain-containing protein [Methylomirabilota bacterium]
MPSERIQDFVISDHARFEMERRGIADDLVQKIVASAEQRLPVHEGRVVLHSRVMMGTPPRMYLVRVVVDIDRWPAEVVTVYRTTKVDRYWRSEP